LGTLARGEAAEREERGYPSGSTDLAERKLETGVTAAADVGACFWGWLVEEVMEEAWECVRCGCGGEIGGGVGSAEPMDMGGEGVALEL
jgi:hypothetical protein